MNGQRPKDADAAPADGELEPTSWPSISAAKADVGSVFQRVDVIAVGIELQGSGGRGTCEGRWKDAVGFRGDPIHAESHWFADETGFIKLVVLLFNERKSIGDGIGRRRCALTFAA
jgi:hypothetical protein